MRLPKRQFIGDMLAAIAILGLVSQFLPYTLAQFRYQNQPPRLVKPRSATRPVYLPVVTTTAPPAGPWLVIPKLNIEVPIVANVDTSSHHSYSQALKNGVAHMKGTAILEATTGNSFIFGHSSRFISSGTPYDTIFAALPHLAANDEVFLSIDGRLHRFQVEKSQAIDANDLAVLKNKNYRQITLMSCWPLGTTLKRWVVQAKEVVSAPVIRTD